MNTPQVQTQKKIKEKTTWINPFDNVTIYIDYYRRDRISALKLEQTIGDKEIWIYINKEGIGIELRKKGGNYDILKDAKIYGGKRILRKINRLLKEAGASIGTLTTFTGDRTIGREIYGIIKLSLLKLAKDNERAMEIIKVM